MGHPNQPTTAPRVDPMSAVKGNTCDSQLPLYYLTCDKSRISTIYSSVCVCVCWCVCECVCLCVCDDMVEVKNLSSTVVVCN